MTAAAANTSKENQRWCICRLCLDGYDIPVEFDGEEYRVCGELCIVGQPTESVVASSSFTIADANLNTVQSPLLCSICRSKVEQTSMSTKPCVSDDDGMISSEN
jgi:hypothetical protein